MHLMVRPVDRFCGARPRLRAHRGRSRRDHPRPHRDRGLPGKKWAAGMMLEIDAVTAGYTAPRRCCARCRSAWRPGQLVAVVGPQRRRQVHPVQDHLRHARPRHRGDPLRGPRHPRDPRRRAGAPRHAHVPEGRQVFPAHGDGEPRTGRHHRRPGGATGKSNRDISTGCRARRAARPDGRHALGRRAADAGHRARAGLLGPSC